MLIFDIFNFGSSTKNMVKTLQEYYSRKPKSQLTLGLGMQH